MCKDLRKVTFRLGSYEYYYGSAKEEQEDMAERTKERVGYFHCWVNDVDTSKDIPCIKTMALVEDDADGTVHMVEYNNFKFSKKQS